MNGNAIHDAEVEMQVLGCILLKPTLIDEIDLRQDDFFNQTHAAVFTKMQELQSQSRPIIPELLRDVLGNDWSFRAGELASSVGAPSHITTYARLVREAAQRRHLRDVGSFLIDHAGEKDAAPESTLERSETMLSEIVLGDNKTKPVSSKQAMFAAAEYIDAISNREQAAGIMTGLYDFDFNVGGLFPGELIILAARPGIGKTSLALQIADHVSAKGKLVYFASLEMSAVELSVRLACSKSCVSNRLVRNGRFTESDKSKLIEAMTNTANSKLCNTSAI